MKYRIVNIIVSIVIISLQNNSASIVSGIDTLSEGHGIKFSDSSIIDFRPQSSSLCVNQFDIFYENVEACCLALCCHCGMRIGSPQELFMSKSPIDSVDFTRVLDLNDSLVFMKADTGGFFRCEDSYSFSEPSDCGTIDFPKYEEAFFLGKTMESLYVLFTIKSILVESPEIKSQWHPGIEIHWHLQTDGKLDFSDITSISVNRTINKQKSNVKTGNYDIRGKTVPSLEKISAPMCIIKSE